MKLVFDGFLTQEEASQYATSMSFEHLNLDERLLKAVEACGFQEPTPIQQQAIPVILDGEDLMGSAQTGTGKTAALFCPSCINCCSASPPRKALGLDVW